MQKNEYFFNLDDLSKGISRKLADGIKTNIFPGEQAMVSIVQIDSIQELSRLQVSIYL